MDYEKIYLSRFKVLREAFLNSSIREEEGFWDFVGENDFWLPDYALYMAVKDAHEGKSWSEIGRAHV